MVLSKSRVNLHQVMRDAVEQMRPLIEQKRHSLRVLKPDDPLIEVMGDHARLVQVLANILMNAAKYTPPGGKLQLSLDIDGPWVKLRVSDNGVGIAADLLPHIFEYFVQAERTADRAEGGLGLGLPLVQNVVAMHGGRVGVQSNGAGEGSIFTVFLPRLASQAKALAPANAPAPRPDKVVPTERGLRILVVDDNADAAVSLGQLLEAYGHAVTVAFDAEQALQLADGHGFDVALLDIGLPGLNGYQLAERLRRMPQLVSCLLLALTGYGTASDSERSRQAGFDHHLVKPLDVDQLFGLICDRTPSEPIH